VLLSNQTARLPFADRLGCAGDHALTRRGERRYERVEGPQEGMATKSGNEGHWRGNTPHADLDERTQ